MPLPDFTNLPEILYSFLPRLFYFVFGGLIVWMRRNVYIYMVVKRKIVVFITRKKYVIIWNDDSPEVSEKIINQIKQKKPGNFSYKIIKTPETILYYPASPREVQAIIIIVTDVTKLDENQQKRTDIEDKLIRYASAGGTLVGTHDIIYRRCRNEKLQKAFGCTLKKFKSAPEGIEVKLNPEYRGHPLLRGLKDSFRVRDNEIVTGMWDNNVHKLIITSTQVQFEDTKLEVPILCVNSATCDGLFIWISCGDKGDEVCDSVKLPDTYFIQMLYNSIRYSKKIKRYNSTEDS